MGLFTRFCGRGEVQRRRRCCQRTGKVTSATLVVRGNSNVAYSYCYRKPQPQSSGIGTDGFPNTEGAMTLFREGEATAPVVDDKIIAEGITYQINEVRPENNADESAGWAVYQLVVT